MHEASPRGGYVSPRERRTHQGLRWVLGWVRGNPLFWGFGHQKGMFSLQDVESNSEADSGGYMSHILTKSITWALHGHYVGEGCP